MTVFVFDYTDKSPEEVGKAIKTDDVELAVVEGTNFGVFDVFEVLILALP